MGTVMSARLFKRKSSIVPPFRGERQGRMGGEALQISRSSLPNRLRIVCRAVSHQFTSAALPCKERDEWKPRP